MTTADKTNEAQIHERLREVYGVEAGGKEKIFQLMNESRIGLDGLSLQQYLDQGKHKEALLYLGRLEHGVYC